MIIIWVENRNGPRDGRACRVKPTADICASWFIYTIQGIIIRIRIVIYNNVVTNKPTNDVIIRHELYKSLIYIVSLVASVEIN